MSEFPSKGGSHGLNISGGAFREQGGASAVVGRTGGTESGPQVKLVGRTGGTESGPQKIVVGRSDTSSGRGGADSSPVSRPPRISLQFEAIQSAAHGNAETQPTMLLARSAGEPTVSGIRPTRSDSDGQSDTQSTDSIPAQDTGKPSRSGSGRSGRQKLAALGLTGTILATGATAACSKADQGVTTSASRASAEAAIEPGAQKLGEEIIDRYGTRAHQLGMNEAEILVNFGWRPDGTEIGFPTEGSIDLVVYEPNPGSLRGAQVEELDVDIIHNTRGGSSTERKTTITDPAITTQDFGPHNSWAATQWNLVDGLVNIANPGASTTIDNPNEFGFPGHESLDEAPGILQRTGEDIRAIMRAQRRGN